MEKRKQLENRIAELEKAYSELNHKALALGLKNPQTQADRIAELEKDLHMIQRHNDQLDHDFPQTKLSDYLVLDRIDQAMPPGSVMDVTMENLQNVASALVMARQYLLVQQSQIRAMTAQIEFMRRNRHKECND